MGLFDKALADYDSALMIKPGDRDFLQNRESARSQLNQGRNISNQTPAAGNPDVYEQQMLPKAYDLYKRKEYQQALVIFQNLAEKAKQNGKMDNYISHQNNMALCYIKLGNAGMAEQILKALLKINDKAERTWLNLGLLYKTVNNKQEAIRMYSEVLKINPQNDKAKIELNNLSN